MIETDELHVAWLKLQIANKEVELAYVAVIAAFLDIDNED